MAADSELGKKRWSTWPTPCGCLRDLSQVELPLASKSRAMSSRCEGVAAVNDAWGAHSLKTLARVGGLESLADGVS